MVRPSHRTDQSPTRLHDLRRLFRLAWEASSSCSPAQAGRRLQSHPNTGLQCPGWLEHHSAWARGHAQLHQCRAVKPEWWTLVFARPRECPPPYQCTAPSVLRPFSVRCEWRDPVADSSNQLSLARPEDAAVLSVWLQTYVYFTTDSRPTVSGHARLPVPSSSCFQLQTWTSSLLRWMCFVS